MASAKSRLHVCTETLKNRVTSDSKGLSALGLLPRISIAAQHEASHPGGAAGFQSMVTSISMPLTGLPGALDAH